VLGLFAPPLSQAVGWLAWLFLSYVIEVVHGFGALPFASQQIGSISGNIVWAYYGLGAGALWIIPSRKRLGASLSKAAAWGQKGLDRFAELTVRLPRKEWVFTFTLLAAALVWLAVIVAPPKQLEVSFLDVKQGDAILAQTPNGQQILIDGGPDPREVSLKLGQKFPFWDKSIDVVVLTHPHDDHLVGLIEVLRRYEVGQVLEPKLDYTSPAYSEWHKLVAEKNIKHIWAQAGQYIELGDGIRMQVLNPQAELFEGTASDIDNNGVVLRLVKDEVSFLLTADIHDEAEWKLLYQGRELRSTVLKVGHHGGRDSTSAQFLAVVDPEIAVISVGENNPFGHPHEETLARLEKKISENKIYLTSKQGTITFTTDGERLWVKTEH
jgi:competence protein ComEC